MSNLERFRERSFESSETAEDGEDTEADEEEDELAGPRALDFASCSAAKE